MVVWTEPEAFRAACDAARKAGQRVGLVPTMGALHDGHVALAEAAGRRADFVVVTVFVNPTQFGPSEDYQRYPRTLDRDRARAEGAGAHGLFAPDVDAMYPPGDATRVTVRGLTAPLCGAHRPGHFEGVTTVVAKLFALAGPCAAVFGRKDYQQLKVVERMARDLLLPVEVIGIPTVREADGLALSSRNAFLSADDRAIARSIPLGLSDAVQAFDGGERDAATLRSLARARLERAAAGPGAAAIHVDYVEVVDPDTLAVCGQDGGSARVGERALLAMAVRVGPTRLIDNVVLGEDPAPVAAAAVRDADGTSEPGRRDA